ncbi:MAG: hypothetical protein KC587_08120 [Nitrospira sp.]|nr:hypothetical protein [Nitrospira sp.]
MTGGLETVPFRSGYVRRVRAARPDILEQTACRLFQVSRSALHRLTK